MRAWAVAAALALAQGAAAEPAKRAFGAAEGPAAGPPAVHGGAAAGCIAGAVALPESGAGWQAVRLSRNRFWTHPDTAAFVGRLGAAALALGWPGVLVGDLSQPRGGPMTSGHVSHQNGLDVDVWLRRPDRADFTRAEREGMSSETMVAPDRLRVTRAFGDAHAALIRAAAADPAVDRVLVNAAIKAELCRRAPAKDRAWLGKVRPFWNHDGHMHVRLSCPAGDDGCRAQAPVPPGDGCDATLDWWFSDEALNPPPPKVPPKPRPDLTLADLPPACARVLSAP
jgi:penicillin-insensitive murein endopeptidase